MPQFTIRMSTHVQLQRHRLLRLITTTRQTKGQSSWSRASASPSYRGLLTARRSPKNTQKEAETFRPTKKSLTPALVQALLSIYTFCILALKEYFYLLGKYNNMCIQYAVRARRSLSSLRIQPGGEITASSTLSKVEKNDQTASVKPSNYHIDYIQMK